MDDSVVHLVVRRTTMSSTDEQTNQTNQTNPPPQNNGNENDNVVPFISFRRNNHRNRRHAAHFDPSDCFECLYQNISTISNIIQCRNTFDYSQIIQNKTIHPFNLSKMKFELGQWVDVKDTIGQWLEGQIVNMRSVNGTIQVQVHYNGWGPRWDEWIDSNSKRLANFKTYTLQGPNTVFLSPNPSNVCDGNVDGQQHRPIDMFYYIEKVTGIMNDLTKTLDYMGKLHKKVNGDRDNIVIEDVNESNGINGGNSKPGLSMNNFIPFSVNETEILFQTSQIIPLLDRCGRLLTDLSLQMSHIILNPNLYPHLLFGHNSNNEISDSMSCTSGYSMYTNESSSISGFTNNLRFLPEQNIANNLQINRVQTNSNTNTMNTNSIIRTYTNQQNNQSNNQVPNQNSNQTNTGNTTSQNSISAFSVPRYVINSSSSELPFIQRLNFSNSLHPNYYNSLSSNPQNPYDVFPKINLQIPPLLNPIEIPMVNGYNPLDEQNIILFSRNVFFDGAQSPPNQPPISHNSSHQMHNMNQENVKTLEKKSDSEDGDDKQEKHKLNNTFLINTNPLIIKNMQARRTGSVLSGRSTLSADQMYTKNYKQFKMENDTQSEMPINLLSLNKDNNYAENYMESISIKSDKNPSLKNKNLSYKSVSEVNEFDESGEDDEDKKDNGGTSQHTEESGYIKEFLEGEENINSNLNDPPNNINNINMNINNNNLYKDSKDDKDNNNN